MKHSRRLTALPVSSTRKLLPYAQAAKEEGVKIYHLNVGDPDMESPAQLLDVLHNWETNPIRYTPATGEPNLIESLQSYYQNLGYEIQKDQIIVTLGGTEAINMSLYAVADPGDEVLVFEPYYSGYLPHAFIHSVKLIPVSTSLSDGFHLPSEGEIEKKITKRTKAILFCSPANPTGTVYSPEEIERLVKIAAKHNLFLIADEVYREFVFTDQGHTSLLKFIEQIPDLAIVIDSLSKRYSLCGARLGIFISANNNLLKGIVKIAQSRLSGGLIDQTMAAALTKVPVSYHSIVNTEYKKRRDFLYKELSEIKGVKLAQPEGAFYAMVELPVDDAEKFCIWLLQKFRHHNETLMFAPGAGFYLSPGKGTKEVRLAYVLPIPELKKCIEMLKVGLGKYSLV